MVYVKRNTYRRFKGKARKPQAWYEKKYNALELAGKAYSGVKYLASMINSEKYVFDASQSLQAVDNNGAVYPLSQIASGDDVNNRTGNSILAKSMYIQGNVLKQASAGASFVRFILFQDTMNQGSTPTVTDILNNTGSALAPLSPLNIDHLSRYKILYDKRITLNSDMSCRQYKVYKKMSSHIKFTGTAATDVYKNGLYFLIISNEALSTAPTINFTSRLRYHEN